MLSRGLGNAISTDLTSYGALYVILYMEYLPGSGQLGLCVQAVKEVKSPIGTDVWPVARDHNHVLYKDYFTAKISQT